MSSNILIAGMGIIGKNMYNFFNEEADIYDPYKGYELKNKTYDFAFICVPTDNVNGKCDISQVEQCISLITAELFVIKSTIPVGSTANLIKKTGKNIIFSPEYFGNTKNNKGLNNHFVILGGEQTLTDKVSQLYMRHTPSNFKIETTDSITAELVKYMENSFIATKVAFVNEFYRIAKIYNIDYSRMRSLFLLDERFSSYFTYVFEDQPYYDSHCLNKDIPALVTHMRDNHDYCPQLLNNIIELNETWKKEHKNKESKQKQ